MKTPSEIFHNYAHLLDAFHFVESTTKIFKQLQYTGTNDKDNYTKKKQTKTFQNEPIIEKRIKLHKQNWLPT